MELFFVPTKWRHSFGQCPYVCSLSFRRVFWDFFPNNTGRNSIQFVMLMSWFSSEWSRFLSRSVYFPNFWFNFHLVKRATFRVCRHYLEITWKNDLHFGMLMHPDLHQTCINFGHGLLIFLILVKWFKLWVSGPFLCLQPSSWQWLEGRSWNPDVF